MRFFNNSLVYWRLCTTAALIAAGVFAPLTFAAIPWLMLVAYVYIIFNPKTEMRFGIPFYLILGTGLPLCFEPVTGIWLSPLFTLLVLPQLDNSLRQHASKHESTAANWNNPPSGKKYPRATRITGLLALSISIIIAAALTLASWTMFISTLVITLYLAVSVTTALVKGNKLAITAEVNETRVVAGNTGAAPVKLIIQAGGKPIGGYIYLDSRLPWFAVKPFHVICKENVGELQASFTPPLAGSTSIQLDASYIDPLGLTRIDFSFKVMNLLVIPRARYAEWMARKFLEAGGNGSLEIADSHVSTINRGSRQGIEFYGLRHYQPGDTARAIDWKHTSKLHQVIVKEFIDKNAECAVISVNLSAGNEEEKDKLVSSFITAALTLARENMPSAIAAYDNLEVIKVTPLLAPQQALLQALKLVRNVTITPNVRRYLTVPDPQRIASNLRGLRLSGTGPGARLAEILELEYSSLEQQVRMHTLTTALFQTLAFMNSKPNIIVVSARNHDEAALVFNRRLLKAKGYKFVDII